MKTWREPQAIQTPDELRGVVGGHPLTAELLARRGITDPQAALAFLDPNAYSPAPSEDFPGLVDACERIEFALKEEQPIWIWGDFDVDGQTSTALLVETLRKLGGNPGYHIPVRAVESHGVNIPHLEPIIAAGARLLVTCDCGITAHEALAYAQNQGLDVIVTDHHALAETLPPALAHITPRLLPHGHPLAPLPGVGVAYKLAEALLRRAGRADEAEQLLDLVALGIVADVALQTGDARYLLQRGLDHLRLVKRAGLRAMLALAEVQPAFLNEEHIGFALAPRLNALGRLADANPAVELLTTEDPSRAQVLAQDLEALNARRQLLTRQVLEAALRQIDRDPTLLASPVLILAHPEWPAGVIGIVASQLVERFDKPTILLSSPPGQNARGSARSIEGLDITSCIAAQAGLLAGYGGHPMAAGLSLPVENLPDFRREMGAVVSEALKRSGKIEISLAIDAWLDLNQATLSLAEDLNRLSPFGPGNPALVFAARRLKLVESSAIGRGREHLAMLVETPDSERYRVLWWGGAAWPQPEGLFDLAYSLRASNYHGQLEAQIEWQDFRPIEAGEVELTSPRYEIVDHRSTRHPKPLLDNIRQEENVLVWAEGEARELVKGQDRTELTGACTLVIWTLPPGREELQKVLETVNPERVILFASDPGPTSPEAFLQRLSKELVRLAAPQEPGIYQVRLDRLAAAMAQREATVRLGFACLEKKGALHLLSIEGNLIRFSPPHASQNEPSAPMILAETIKQLKILLDESAAYRRYYTFAPVTALI
jgi:single-stranded-DNA-specific exonuclease